MSVYPIWRAGMKLSESRLEAMQWTYLSKSADETVTSSTTLQNDNDLFFSVAANATYYIRAHLDFGGLTAADFKCAYTFPALSDGRKICLGPQSGTTDRQDTTMCTTYHALGTERNYGCMSTVAGDIPNEGMFAIEHVLLQTGANAGTFQLQWAQVTSNATATELRIDSFFMYKRMI
jgi:hypothetical protein